MSSTLPVFSKKAVDVDRHKRSAPLSLHHSPANHDLLPSTEELDSPLAGQISLAFAFQVLLL